MVCFSRISNKEEKDLLAFHAAYAYFYGFADFFGKARRRMESF